MGEEATTHRQRFGHLAAQPDLLLRPNPVPNAWDGHDPLELAKALLGRARSLLADPWAWAVLADRADMDDWQLEEFKHEVWQPEDLPDLMGFPLRGDKGKRLRPKDRLELARTVIDLAQEETSAAEGTWRYTSPSRAFRPVDTGWYEMMPPHLTEAILADAFTHDRKSRIKLVPRAEARAFIIKHHKHMPWIRDNGWIYSIGLYNGRRLAAVATGHTVTGGWAAGKKKNRPPRQIPVYCDYDEVSPDADVERVSLDPRNILELSRVASDGTIKGASSMLAARILKLAPATRRGDPDGPWLFITYSLDSEEGSTYKALRELGLRPVHRRLPRRSKTGARVGGELRAHDYEPKIRWEAGPAAMPADPLLEAEFEKPRRRRRKKGRGRSSSALSQIQRIAESERAALEAGYVGALCPTGESFRGACYGAAARLATGLREEGFDARRVGGAYVLFAGDEDAEFYKHWWVEVLLPTGARLLVDTTADQFHEGERLYRVVVTDRFDPHYQRDPDASLPCRKKGRGRSSSALSQRIAESERAALALSARMRRLRRGRARWRSGANMKKRRR